MWFFKKKIKLICFDLDNTLCDYGTAEAETEAYIAQLIADKIEAKSPIDVLRAFNAVKASHMHHDEDPLKFSRALWLEETVRKLGSKKKIDYARLETLYWDHLAMRAVLFSNSKDTLDSLKRRFKLALLTDSDGRREIKINRLKALGIDSYFDYIITTDDTGKNKPCKENWEYLLKVSGLEGKQCMMVGDHPDVDLIAAKSLGFTTVWTKQHLPSDVHFQYVDYEIKDIGEILKIAR